MSGFKINDSKGFHITFENGWTVSVQFGPGSYGSNYNMPIGREGSLEAGERGSATAECWSWGPGGKNYPKDVLGYQTPSQVLAFINKVARKKAPDQEGV
jgi:hypothetical protein